MLSRATKTAQDCATIASIQLNFPPVPPFSGANWVERRRSITQKGQMFIDDSAISVAYSTKMILGAKIIQDTLFTMFIFMKYLTIFHLITRKEHFV